MNSTKITLALLNAMNDTIDETNHSNRNDHPDWQTNEKIAAVSTFLAILTLLSVGCLILYLFNKCCHKRRNDTENTLEIDEEQRSPLLEFQPAHSFHRQSRSIPEEEAEKLDQTILEQPRPTRSPAPQ